MIEPTGSPHQCEVDVSTFEVYKYFPDRKDAIIGADCKHCDAKFIKIMRLYITAPCDQVTCCATTEDYNLLGGDDSHWPCINEGSVDVETDGCSKCGCRVALSDGVFTLEEYANVEYYARDEWNQMEKIWEGKIPSNRR